MSDNEVDDLESEVPDETDFEVGEYYVIQTDTLWFFTGQCSEVTESHVVFTEASWIQEMGPVDAFMQRGNGIGQSLQYFGENRPLRVAKRHIVFDVRLDNITRSSLSNGRPTTTQV